MGEKLPRHIKRIVEEGPFIDDGGAEYSRVTVVFRWWYLPIAWWYSRRLRPIEDQL
jgi:hypothetical protein